MPVQGLTVTATARVTTVRVSSRLVRVIAMHQTPRRVEVLDVEGRTRAGRIRDVDLGVRLAIVVTGILVLLVGRTLRRKS
jgi:hypothetical protein